MFSLAYWLLALLLFCVPCHAEKHGNVTKAERPSFDLDITFNKKSVANGKDGYDRHFDTIMNVLSDFLHCDKKAINATSLSHDGFSVKVRFAINGKSEKEVAKVIGDYQFKFKFPLELTNHGVYVVTVNTVNRSWGDASEPSTTAPIMNAYFHVNFTFNQDDEDAGSNGAETYERHRDAIQRVFADYLDCDKSAINATLISHTYETAEVRFVLTDVSERQVARKIDDDWHFAKLAWEFIKNSVPVTFSDTTKTSWERDSYSSSAVLTAGFMASILLLGTFF